MVIVDRIERAIVARADAVRARSRPIDHIFRAYARYDGIDGTRLAAATAYYGFFAAFALGVLAFAVVGWAIPGSSKAGLDAVQEYLSGNLPQLDADSLTKASARIGVLAIFALIIAGVGWIETLRSSQRALWCLEQHPGHPVVRWLLDLAVLAVLGGLLLVSIAVSSGLRGVLLGLRDQAEDVLVPAAAEGFVTWTDAAIAAGVDLVLACSLLAVVPRLRMPFRRLIRPALLVVVGLGVLKVIGRWFITRTQHNPAYENFTAAAAAVGLLLFMYFFHQIVLFAAALAATSNRGVVYDMSRRPKRMVPDPEPNAPTLTE
ncbi:YihY/virulence factor BrkB family protein [Virgisporangium aurantiacum]|uniref:YihY/virulence factor BrkB family protein n=1 Tax=Virgisporangium aurantiacum TaxID=175570 RepID=UPI00194E740E|nr:YhjD/YihY/BrkB family envelope integrity protein [Virgisporangium aurantiacum]